MKLRCLILFSAALLFILPETAAQRSTHVRVFRPAGTYPANITIAPSGAALSRSGDTPNLLILDGYTRREVAMAIETPYRVYQSRSSQLWSVTREGLQFFHGEQWTLHPVAEIRTEMANNPIRQLRQISLLPAEVNRVLILLSDRLLEYDAGTRTTGLLRLASDTSLGEFLEMQEGIDETVWISGTYGFASIQGPIRRVSAASRWKEFLLPETNIVNTLQRPFEFPQGTVTASANSATGDGRRFVVRVEDNGIKWFPILGEKIKQALGAWDDGIWGYSSTTLFRIEDQPGIKLIKEPVSGAQYDIASETNGVFWVASSEGLTRYAPLLWRPPAGLEDLQSSMHSLAFDSLGNLWAASPEGLIHIEGKSLSIFPWPESVESLVLPRDTLNITPNGRVVIGAGGRLLVFEPQSQSFSFQQVPPGVQVNILGPLNNGEVCAWFESATNEFADLRGFDGVSFRQLELPPIPLQGAELIVVCETKAREFWFGTSAGIIHVQPGIENIENHGADLGLDFERVTAIAELADGKLWCGTTSHAYEFSNGRWQRRLRTPDRVTGIISAAGSVWVGTPARLYRWLEGSWIEHTGNEGVLGNGVYALKLSPNHKLLAGTSRGIITFHPDADTDPPRTWSPVLPDTRTPSTLEPTTVVFRGNDKWDYTMPTDLLFSYKLDEAPWTPYSNTTSRVFQNLSSGTHVVEVRAMDRNGNQSSIPSRIEFAVIVPWFQDPRLLVVMVLALFFSLIFAAYAVLKHFELKRSYAEVEQIVRQRTGELQKANQELLHSQKMRAIGTMAAGIAHDFNNILSIIKGSAQIIERNVDDRDKIKTRVNRIQTVVEQGTSIVKALLGLGRMNEQDLSPCNLGTLLKEIRKLLADRFSTDVRFEVDVENTLAEPICSREVLQQMLLNFILNAVEAMGGKGLVRLTTREVTALPPDIVLEPSVAESYVIVSVVDLGSGIAPENLPRIFEPFFTTKGFSSRRGTGLGLSMVYELAKGLGYGVAVKSVVGEGSSFSIVLPFKPAREEAEPGNPSVTSPSSSTECRRK